MIRARYPNIIYVVNRMVSLVSEKLNDKFKEYYINRIKEVGLGNKTFYFPFDIGGSFGRSELRRSISKLKSLFIKHLLKTNPFLAYAKTDYMTDGATDNITLHICDSRWDQTIPGTDYRVAAAAAAKRFGINERSVNGVTPPVAVNSHENSEILAFCNNKYRSLFRYADYLNYLCRKHNVPLYAKVQCITESTDELRNGQNVTVYRMKVSMLFSFQAWYPRDTLNINLIKDAEPGLAKDSIFARDSYWTTVPLSGDLRELEWKDVRKYHPSKIFLHMDKGIKILNTLLRKLQYVSAAYTFTSN